MRYPTRPEQELMRASLGGFTEFMPAITLEHAREVVLRVTHADVRVDGMLVARMLNWLGYRRSYLPQDKAVITYRRDVA